MAVNPIQFLVASNASILDGSKTISISGNVDCSRVYSGTAVFLGGADNPAEAISGTSPDGSGVSTITLRNNWTQGDVSNQPLVSFNTNEGLAEAISNVREIVSNVSAIEDLATQGLIKRIDDNNYEVVDITSLGESLVGANDSGTARSVLGLGSAATKNVGTSSGNVMEVGAFGIGAESPQSVDNLDTHTENGLFAVTSPVAIGLPVSRLGSLIQANRVGVRRVQIFLTDGGTERMFQRAEGSEGWKPWVELYHSGNSVNPIDWGLGEVAKDSDGDTNSGNGFFHNVGTEGWLSGSASASQFPYIQGSRSTLGSSVGWQFGAVVGGSPGNNEAIFEGRVTSAEDGDWGEIVRFHHSGNTNFDEFIRPITGQNQRAVIARGYAVTSTYAEFYLPINSNDLPTGISVFGTLLVRDLQDTSSFANLTAGQISLDSRSTNKVAVLAVSGLTGLTSDKPLKLMNLGEGDGIKVNF